MPLLGQIPDRYEPITQVVKRTDHPLSKLIGHVAHGGVESPLRYDGEIESPCKQHGKVFIEEVFYDV